MKKALATALQVAFLRGDHHASPDGVLFPRQGVLISGDYFVRHNEGAWEQVKNLVPNEGVSHFLNVAMGSTPKPAAYYLTLFSGSATPAANWTAASFAATANEVVSMTEGYTSATRPVWTPANTTDGTIGNMSDVARLTMATASSLTVTGAAMLTTNVRGGNGGVLLSATKYPVARTFQNGDTFDIGYRLSLTV